MDASHQLTESERRVVRHSLGIPLELVALDASACASCGGPIDKRGHCARRCEQQRVARMNDAATGAE